MTETNNDNKNRNKLFHITPTTLKVPPLEISELNGLSPPERKQKIEAHETKHIKAGNKAYTAAYLAKYAEVNQIPETLGAHKKLQTEEVDAKREVLADKAGKIAGEEARVAYYQTIKTSSKAPSLDRDKTPPPLPPRKK